jgi:hypothetical protein
MLEHAPFCPVQGISNAENQMSSRLRTVNICRKPSGKVGFLTRAVKGKTFMLASCRNLKAL